MQLEYPWALGPPDGRYVVRGHAGAAEHVLVLATLGAPRRRWLRGRRARATTASPAPVATSRATLVAATPFADPQAAERWLRDADLEAEVGAAVRALDRVLHLYRTAAADAHAHEVDRGQAIVARVGFGEGEQVADGRWARAVEVPAARVRRGAALRAQERLAALLGGRDAALACEELALRARLDVDAGRRREAAFQIDAALTAAIAELAPWAPRGDLAARLGELRALQPRVEAAAGAAREGGVDDAAAVDLAHALERLEAALRARTALGYD